MYCFACIFFQSSAKENSFTLTGFDNWNHAVGDKNKGLDHHASTSVHIQAMIKWEHYQSNQVTIQERLNPYRSTLVNDNRDYFHKIISYIKWFCLQEVALSGENEMMINLVIVGTLENCWNWNFSCTPNLKLSENQ